MTADQYVKLYRLTDEVVAYIEANDNLEELIRAQGAYLRKLRLQADIVKKQGAIDEISQQIATYRTDPGRYFTQQEVGKREELTAYVHELTGRYETLCSILHLAHDCIDAAAETYLKQNLSEALDRLRDQYIKSLKEKLELCTGALAFRYYISTLAFIEAEPRAGKQQDASNAVAENEDLELYELSATETELLKALLFQQHRYTVLDTKTRVSELYNGIISYLRQFRMREDEFRNYKQVVSSKVECLLNSVNYANILRHPALEECSEAYQHAVSRYQHSGGARGYERPVSTGE